MGLEARRYGVIAALSMAVLSPAEASDTPEVFSTEAGNFLNLSYTGDGSSPSAMSRFAALERASSAPRAAAHASDRGDATWSLRLDLPPALLAPALSLDYSSAGSDHSFISRGWTLSGGMTIEQIVGPAGSHAYADLRQAYKVSGGGLDGLAFASAGVMTYVSNEGVAVRATQDGRTWTIEHAGVTTTLAPDDSVSWLEQNIRPTSWHPTRMRDKLGNTVDYVWNGNRLDSITYGGTTTAAGAPALEPTVEVVFNYAGEVPSDGVEVTYEARDGHVDTIAHRLESVVISGQPFGVSVPRVYDLVYSRIGEKDSLASVSVSDGTSSVLLASLQYAVYPNGMQPEIRDESWAIPPFLAATIEHDDLNVDGGFGHAQASFQDVTGDGLADALAESTAYGDSSRFVWDTSFRANFEVNSLNTEIGFDETRNVRCFDTVESVSVRRVVDVDGDGFLDQVQSLADVPDSYVPSVPDPSYEPSALCDSSSPDAGAGWRIHYGSADGIEEIAFVVAPVSFPTHVRPPSIENVQSSDWTDADYEEFSRWADSEGPTGDLMDMDGDGWLDIVQIVPGDVFESHHLRVWYWEGDRHGDYDGPYEVIDEASPLHTLASSLATSRQHEVVATLDITQAYWEQATFRVDELRLQRTFTDINGDGIPDYVDASTWTATDRAWDVYLGTGARGSAAFLTNPADVIRWRAARPYLSRTAEGFPDSLICGDVPNDGIEFIPGNFAPIESGLTNPFGNDVGIDLTGLFAAAMQTVEFVLGTRWDCYQALDSCDGGNGGSSGGDDDGSSQSEPGGEPGGGTTWSTEPRDPLVGTGLGDGFRATVDSNSGAVPVNCGMAQGTPDLQVGGLLDMDGDGRQDLVDAADRRWWRNTGGGFASIVRTVPTWFPEALHTARSRQQVALSGDGLSSPPPPGQDPLTYVASTAANHYVTSSVMDLDRDGMPDVVDVDDPLEDDHDEPLSVTYGPRAVAGPAKVDVYDMSLADTGGARPGLLIRIVTQSGAETTLAYASSATMYPSGNDPRDGVTQEMATHRDVVTDVHVLDPVTGQGGHTYFQYAYGLCEDGLCNGFGERTAVVQVHDPVVHPLYNWHQFVSRTTTAYLQHRDALLPLSVQVEIDPQAPGLTGPQSPDWPFWAVDRRETYTYATRTLGTSTASANVFWLDRHDLDEHSAYDVNTGLEVGPHRLSYDTFVRDAFGNVTEAEHILDVPNGNDDEFRVVTTYAHDDANTHFLPATQATYGAADKGRTKWILVEAGSFGYDGNPDGTLELTAGLLTSQSVQAGIAPSLNSEILEWTFSHTPRGALEHIESPGDRQVDRTHTFGDALVETELNGEAHETTHEYDEFGRELVTIDPNGVLTRVERDVLGRPTQTFLTPQGGVERAVETNTYLDVPGASSIRTFHRNYTATGAMVTRWNRQVLDGFGDVVQTWSPAESSNEWIVTDQVRNVMGAVVRTSWPRRLDFSRFFSSFASNRSTRYLAWSEPDAFGRPRRTFEDKQSGLGEVTFSYPRPGEVVETDADGYRRITKHDTLGRIVDVVEGNTTTTRRTGTWLYDARDRVTGLIDAAGNAYGYSYDGAGRLRSVGRKTGSVASPAAVKTTGWYAYEYDGPDPVEMWEGPVGTGTLVAQWAYDRLGRTVQKDVLDRATGAFDTYTWEWDTRWIGARTRVTDPSGTTDYNYGTEWFGRKGDQTFAGRTWTTLPDDDEAFGYVYRGHDLDGNVTLTHWPSNSVVASDYTDTGWLIRSEVSVGPDTQMTVDYTYDAFGLPDGWTGGETGSGDFDVTSIRTSPTRLQSTTWTVPTGGARSISYAWSDGGLLERKTISGVLPISYEYDAWRRVTSVAQPLQGVLESWTYDAVNNPTSMTRSGEGTWTYEPAKFSEIKKRTSSLNGAVEKQDWDDQGRMSSWSSKATFGNTKPKVKIDTTRSYSYDGAGRLVGVTTTGTNAPAATVYGYDVDDQLVYEAHASGERIYRFLGRRDEVLPNGQGEAIEQLLPMVSTGHWTFVEPDGHALATYDGDGNELTFDVLGAYGAPLAVPGHGSWPVQAFHGSDPDRANGLVNFGVRHMLGRGDGVWMQPEPLLYLGPTNGDLSTPLAYVGVYSSGNPLASADEDGGFLWALVMAACTPEQNDALSGMWAPRDEQVEVSAASSTSGTKQDYAAADVRSSNGGQYIFRAFNDTDAGQFEAGTRITPAGSGGSILDQVQGRPTKYISASERYDAAAGMDSGFGVAKIDVNLLTNTGSTVVDHSNVMLALAPNRGGTKNDRDNAEEKDEVLIKGGIDPSAVNGIIVGTK